MSLIIAAFAAVVSMVGWLVTYRLTQRTQNLAIVNTLENEARIAITRSIRELHDCCSELGASLGAATVDHIIDVAGDGRARRKRCAEIRELTLSQRTLNWARTLEEYECLFPETAKVRVQLLQMSGEVFLSVRRFVDDYEQGVKAADAPENRRCSESILDLVALTFDLMNYVQNKSIGEITGHKIAQRTVLLANLPRITPSASGELVIDGQPSVNFDGGENRASVTPRSRIEADSA